MEYSVKFRPAALRSMKKIPKRVLVRIKKRIEKLATLLPDPQITKMKGNNPYHKVRCGDYRILYEIHGNELCILIVKVGHRKDVYRNLTHSN